MFLSKMNQRDSALKPITQNDFNGILSPSQLKHAKYGELYFTPQKALLVSTESQALDFENNPYATSVFKR
jgi:hypothetical protein